MKWSLICSAIVVYDVLKFILKNITFIMSDRKLIPAEKRKYSLEEKESQRQLCKRYKEEYNAKIPKS